MALRKIEIDSQRPDFMEGVEIIKALAHSVRIRILELLRNGGEKSARQIAEALNIKAPNVRFHLHLLRDAGFIVSKQHAHNTHIYEWRYKLLNEGAVILLKGAKP